MRTTVAGKTLELVRGDIASHADLAAIVNAAGAGAAHRGSPEARLHQREGPP